jgi:hypothetical protein
MNGGRPPRVGAGCALRGLLFAGLPEDRVSRAEGFRKAAFTSP